jgi:hypothetical protein
MTVQELDKFRARCLKAKTRGYRVANAEAYVAALEAEAGPVTLGKGVAPNSPAHLVALADQAAEVRSGKKAPAADKPKPKKKAAKKKKKSEEPVEAVSDTEPAPEPEPEPEAAPEPAPEPEAAPEPDDENH